MLQLLPLQSGDALEICRWPQSETEFYYWSAGKLGSYPARADELLRFYAKPENRFCGLYCAYDSNDLCGHFTLRYLDDAHTSLRFGFIIVNPDSRGKGYGKQMLLEALSYCGTHFPRLPVSLGVFAENTHAINCYKAVGFSFTGEKQQLLLPNGSLCEYRIMGKAAPCFGL